MEETEQILLGSNQQLGGWGWLPRLVDMNINKQVCVKVHGGDRCSETRLEEFGVLNHLSLYTQFRIKCGAAL